VNEAIATIWTLIALVGVIYSGLNLRSANRSLQAVLESDQNGLYMEIAQSGITLHRYLTLAQGLFAIIGLYNLAIWVEIIPRIAPYPTIGVVVLFGALVVLVLLSITTHASSLRALYFADTGERRRKNGPP